MGRRVACRIVLIVVCLSAYLTSPVHADSYLLAFDERPLRLLDVRLTLGQVTEVTHGVVDRGFVTDPALVGRIGLDDRHGEWNLTLLPEAGGSFWSAEQVKTSLFVAGIGVGWTKGPWLFGMVPSVVVGRYQRGEYESLAKGYRITTMIELMQVAGVQATYQRLEVDGRLAHQTMLSGSLNLIPLYVLARICGG